MNKKRIVCFGDSNTWGADAEHSVRFEDDERWAAIAGELLGPDYCVLEEGLSGRTTVFDDPVTYGLCGAGFLPVCLMSHQPVDLLIIMLGTNDTKERFAATPYNIYEGLLRLVRTARALPVWRGEAKILVTAPIIIGEKYKDTPVFGTMGRECDIKSRALPALFRECAWECSCAFLDCNELCTANTTDYMHLDRASHRALGERMAGEIKKLV